MSEMKRHTIVAWLEDKPGVLSRVTGLFSRRNFNIESLTVGHSEQPGVSRMTFVVRGTKRDLQQVVTQLDKLINVIDIADVSSDHTVLREMALIKVKSDNQHRGEIMQLVDIYRAMVVDVDMESIMIQIVGTMDQIDSLIRLLDNFGIQEMVRTGSVAMVRGKALSKSASVIATSASNGKH